MFHLMLCDGCVAKLTTKATDGPANGRGSLVFRKLNAAPTSVTEDVFGLGSGLVFSVDKGTPEGTESQGKDLPDMDAAVTRMRELSFQSAEGDCHVPIGSRSPAHCLRETRAVVGRANGEVETRSPQSDEEMTSAKGWWRSSLRTDDDVDSCGYGVGGESEWEAEVCTEPNTPIMFFLPESCDSVSGRTTSSSGSSNNGCSHSPSITRISSMGSIGEAYLSTLRVINQADTPARRESRERCNGGVKDRIIAWESKAYPTQEKEPAQSGTAEGISSELEMMKARYEEVARRASSSPAQRGDGRLLSILMNASGQEAAALFENVETSALSEGNTDDMTSVHEAARSLNYSDAQRDSVEQLPSGSGAAEGAKLGRSRMGLVAVGVGVIGVTGLILIARMPRR